MGKIVVSANVVAKFGRILIREVKTAGISLSESLESIADDELYRLPEFSLPDEAIGDIKDTFIFWVVTFSNPDTFVLKLTPLPETETRAKNEKITKRKKVKKCFIKN